MRPLLANVTVWELVPNQSRSRQVAVMVSGINDTVTAERDWVGTSSQPVTFMTGSSNDLINARYCRYSVMSS